MRVHQYVFIIMLLAGCRFLCADEWKLEILGGTGFAIPYGQDYTRSQDDYTNSMPGTDTKNINDLSFMIGVCADWDIFPFFYLTGGIKYYHGVTGYDVFYTSDQSVALGEKYVFEEIAVPVLAGFRYRDFSMHFAFAAGPAIFFDICPRGELWSGGALSAGWDYDAYGPVNWGFQADVRAGFYYADFSLDLSLQYSLHLSSMDRLGAGFLNDTKRDFFILAICPGLKIVKDEDK